MILRVKRGGLEWTRVSNKVNGRSAENTCIVGKYLDKKRKSKLEKVLEKDE